ncbi:MAG: hypothetical protein A2Y07_10620 [Planctomycetes bacterium GWF2_50_10]|nr:MAG: hypothetical protein A2Y07_10620 [Planctomycetes bacterium GWF2_50_10]
MLRLVLAIQVILTAGCGAWSNDDPNCIMVGSERQLLIDNMFFAESNGVTLRMHPAVKTGEKNVVRENVWESATLNWFNVMEDSGKYRMWYECYDVNGWPTGDDTSFCYAESKDGIHWDKPSLGLFAYQGSKENNILFRQIGPEGAKSRVHGTGVFKDPNAPAESRYKAVSQGIFTGEKGFETSSGGMMYNKIAGMYSADGFNWKRYPKSISDEFADSQYCGFWDSSISKYVIYGRACSFGRVIGRSESSDFSTFKPLSLVLAVDSNEFPSTQLYNPAAMKYPYAANAYFMFPSFYHIDTEKLEIHMAVSRDGVKWTWPEQDKAFIAQGEPNTFDSSSLYMGQGILRFKDELWQYYQGSPLKHNESELENLVKPGNSMTYSRVTSRLDGYVSADANDGFFITPKMIFSGNILVLNAVVRPSGSVRVGLIDENGKAVAGHSVEECEVFSGDHVRKMVMWKNDGDVSMRAGKPTQLKVEIKNASLYAFGFSKGYPYRIK